MSDNSIRNTYYRNINTLRRCQLAHDSMEPPEYWDGPDDDETEEVDEDE